MKKYAIQERLHYWDKKWTIYKEYETLDEAKAAFERLPSKTDYRIVEAYTVIRYKKVKF